VERASPRLPHLYCPPTHPSPPALKVDGRVHVAPSAAGRKAANASSTTATATAMKEEHATRDAIRTIKWLCCARACVFVHVHHTARGCDDGTPGHVEVHESAREAARASEASQTGATGDGGRERADERRETRDEATEERSRSRGEVGRTAQTAGRAAQTRPGYPSWGTPPSSLPQALTPARPACACMQDTAARHIDPCERYDGTTISTTTTALRALGSPSVKKATDTCRRRRQNGGGNRGTLVDAM